MTGFALTLDTSGQFSTSAQVIGKMYAADYATPTPATLTTAVSDMGTAFTDATGRVNPDFTNLGSGQSLIMLLILRPPLPASGEIGGLTLAPGLYKWTTGVTVDSAVTISGAATDSESIHSSYR